MNNLNATTSALEIVVDLIQLGYDHRGQGVEVEDAMRAHLLARLVDVPPADQQSVGLLAIVAAASIAAGFAGVLDDFGDDVQGRLSALGLSHLLDEIPDDASGLLDDGV